MSLKAPNLSPAAQAQPAKVTRFTTVVDPQKLAAKDDMLAGMVDAMKSHPPERAAQELKEFAEAMRDSGEAKAADRLEAVATEVGKTGELPVEVLQGMLKFLEKQMGG